ncbi:MAG TPA: rod shape-determining protein MreD [Gammaproteobacteria bacterium]|nr:rod shape-determining protein MreD [Gammaproteobacteria bacterium]
MNALRLSGWGIIIFTLIVGLLLMILPLPHWAMAFRPAWLLLIMIYWSIALPHRVGILTAWSSGLVLDILQGTLLGENALAFALIVYISLKMHRQFRLFSLLMQSVSLFFLLLLNQLLLFWLQGLQGQTVSVKWFLGPPLVSACLWPWIFFVLTDCLRRYRLY